MGNTNRNRAKPSGHHSGWRYLQVFIIFSGIDIVSRIMAIVEGWWYYITSNKKKTELSKPRTAICNLCQHKNKKLNSCNECGCFLPAKTRVEDAECPFGYW